MRQKSIQRVAQGWVSQATPKEHFLVMFKPLAIRGNLTEDLKGQLSELNLTLEESRHVKVDRNLMAQMYDDYKHRPFFNKLINYYDDKPVEVCRYTGPLGSMLSLQRRMGPYDPTMCIPGEDFGADAMPAALTNAQGGIRDLIHVSDHRMDAARELAIWRLMPPGDATLEIPSRNTPIPLDPEVLTRAILIQDEWSKLSDNDPVNKIDTLAELFGATLLSLFRAEGISVGDVMVIETPEKGRVIWFLPDKALVNPVYIMPGQAAIYAARSGGNRGSNLGWDDLVEVANRQIKLSGLA